MLGSVYLQQAELLPAQQESIRALKINPDLAVAHYNLSLMFRKEGKRAEEQTELRNCLALDPKLAAARKALRHIEGSVAN